MQIALDIPDQIAAEAKSQGVPVEEYVRRLLERIAAPAASQPEHNPAQIEAFLPQWRKDRSASRCYQRTVLHGKASTSLDKSPFRSTP